MRRRVAPAILATVEVLIFFGASTKTHFTAQLAAYVLGDLAHSCGGP